MRTTLLQIAKLIGSLISLFSTEMIKEN